MIGAAARVRNQCILAADRGSIDDGAANHLAGDRERQGDERPILIDLERVGTESPDDAAVLNHPEVRHAVRPVSVGAVIDPTHDRCARLNGERETQVLHPFEMAGVGLLTMDEHPAEVPHREFPIDLFDLIQKPVEGVVESRV